MKVSSIKKIPSISKTYSKSEILKHMAESAEIATKQAKSALESLYALVEAHMKKSGPGIFILPGLLKCQIIRKPATKARKGINPFTKEETTFKAKPARNVVKVRALKKLKGMVA
jgi:DNA-binding protein HU-beta